jgi:MFS family permease
VLRQVYPEDFEVEPVILDIRESIEREIIAEREMGWNIVLFPTPAIQRMLLVGVGIAITQQTVGLEAIQYFLLYIIDESGIDTSETQTGAMIFLGLLKIVFLIIGGKLFDRKGRRTVLFVSLSGRCCSMG